MILQVETFIVIGEVVTRNSVMERDLAVKVKKEINKFLSNMPAENVVDIKVDTANIGVSGDTAFVTILYKSDAKEPEKVKAADQEKAKTFRK